MEIANSERMQVDLVKLKSNLDGELQKLEERRNHLLEQMQHLDAIIRFLKESNGKSVESGEGSGADADEKNRQGWLRNS